LAIVFQTVFFPDIIWCSYVRVISPKVEIKEIFLLLYLFQHSCNTRYLLFPKPKYSYSAIL
jgi:hypothetical protein